MHSHANTIHTRCSLLVLRLLALELVTMAACVGTAAAQSTAPAFVYDTLFYTHDNLRLEAYLYKPQGTGPFPLVVYNHGSAPPDQERVEWPAPFVARLLVPAGYAVLVPERRGYAKSEGTAFSEDIGQERGDRFVGRLQAEAGDVNAAVDYVLKMPDASIDPKARRHHGMVIRRDHHDVCGQQRWSIRGGGRSGARSVELEQK